LNCYLSNLPPSHHRFLIKEMMCSGLRFIDFI
jgi:hypothetical protein